MPAGIFTEGTVGDFGDTGSSGAGGGGSSSGPTPGNPSLLSSTGGISGATSALFLPCMWNGRSVIAIFDPSNFNTEEDIYYDFKQEVIKDGTKPTIHRVTIVYRNLGKVTLDVYHSAFIENSTGGQFGTQGEYNKTIGNDLADGKLYTAFFSYLISGERPQLHIRRSANKGALSIVRVIEYGNQGDGPQL